MIVSIVALGVQMAQITPADRIVINWQLGAPENEDDPCLAEHENYAYGLKELSILFATLSLDMQRKHVTAMGWTPNALVLILPYVDDVIFKKALSNYDEEVDYGIFVECLLDTLHRCFTPLGVDTWEVVDKDTIRRVHKILKPLRLYEIQSRLRRLYNIVFDGVTEKPSFFKAERLPWIVLFEDIMPRDDKQKMHNAIDRLAKQKRKLMQAVHEELLEYVFHPDRMMRIGKDTFLAQVS